MSKDLNDFRKAITDVVQNLSNEAGETIDKEIVATITRALITPYKNKDLLSHFKFDFSFSLVKNHDRISHLRYTYNNHNEKGSFDKKILRIFRIFNSRGDNRYSVAHLKKIFNEIPVAGRHQTTFGIDWPVGATPRLKIYLEELLLSGKNDLSLKKLSKICDILGFKPEYIFSTLKDFNISVIGVDFFNDATSHLKVYNYSRLLGLQRYKNILTAGQYGYFKRFFDLLKKEKSSFYQIAYRFSQAETFTPLKILKIYENSIIDYHASFTEILLLLRRWHLKRHEHFIKKLFLLCAQKGFIMYPCIISTDRPAARARACKADLHFSIKHKSYVQS